MRGKKVWAIFALFAVLLISIGVFVWVISGAHFKPCAVPPDIEKYGKATASLDQVVDLGIKLSTTLAGLGVALLLGLKSGLKSTPLVRLLVVIGTICFVESTLYAVWWRTGISELWYNNCPPLVFESRLTYRFNAHFAFFVGGNTWEPTSRLSRLKLGYAYCRHRHQANCHDSTDAMGATNARWT